MAVSERFELSLGINLNTLSRRAPSATQPAHRIFNRRYAREKATTVQVIPNNINLKRLDCLKNRQNTKFIVIYYFD